MAKYVSEYDPKYIKEVDKYLISRKDRNVSYIIKKNATTLKSNKKKQQVVYGTRFKVNLPTIEGFAKYIGFSKKTLYNWAKAKKDFRKALDKIKAEQKTRLIDMGLSGNYNPTIAKLILSNNHGMRDRFDATSGDKPLDSNFNDDQIDKIADRINRRKINDGGTSGSKKSD